MLKKLNNRGDTIVEVTIAVALLSVVLAAAYAVTTRAARLGQAARERTQAVALVQQQAEIIQSYALRDWDNFADGFRASGENHYDILSWEAVPGVLDYNTETGQESAADYQVFYSATQQCRVGCVNPAVDIDSIEFIIRAEWTPASDSPLEFESTEVVVRVSQPRARTTP